MEVYMDYKRWWLEYMAPSRIPSTHFGDTPEEAFSQYVTDLGLYGLMETLVSWSDNSNTKGE